MEVSKDYKKDFLKESEDGLIKFILNPENRGFAHANNLALKKTKSEYILLLNSDTVVLDNCLEASLNYMETHQDTGALGCKVVLPR